MSTPEPTLHATDGAATRIAAESRVWAAEYAAAMTEAGRFNMNSRDSPESAARRAAQAVDMYRKFAGES